MKQSCRKRRRCLLACAREDYSLEQVNDKLSRMCLEATHTKEWMLWVNYYSVLANDNPLYERELINNNRTLSWFAEDLKRRYNKKIIS